MCVLMCVLMWVLMCVPTACSCVCPRRAHVCAHARVRFILAVISEELVIRNGERARSKQARATSASYPPLRSFSRPDHVPLLKFLAIRSHAIARSASPAVRRAVILDRLIKDGYRPFPKVAKAGKKAPEADASEANEDGELRAQHARVAADS